LKISSIYTSVFEKGEVDTAGLVTRRKEEKEGGREEERKERRRDERREGKKGMVMLVIIHWNPSQVISLQMSQHT